MKLVRLCSSNNGVFNSNFGNDMVLEANSKMALLNLTFKSDIGILALTDTMKLTTWTDNSKVGTLTTINLDAQNFDTDQVGFDKFISALEFALNSSLEISRGSATNYNSSGSQFRIIKNSGGRYVIIFRYTPFINPMSYYDKDGSRPEIMDYDEDTLDITTTTTAVGPPPKIEQLTTIQLKANIDSNVAKEYSMLSETQLSKGCGFMSARVADLVDNTSASQDNGFGIGLARRSFNEIGVEPGEPLTLLGDTFAEIRINRPLEPYYYISDETAVENTSGVYPHRVGATPLVTGYLNLPLGNDWTQAPAVATERFDSVNLGPIATYRRTQVGSAVEHWWEATSATAWNVYFTGPPTPGQTVDTTATADLTTGVISFDTSGTTFTPTGGVPAVVNVPVNVNLHDVMGFEIKNGKCDIVVYQNKTSPANRVVLDSIILDEDTELYPYLYVNGARGSVKVDMFSWTANSLQTVNSDNYYLNNSWGPGEYESGTPAELYKAQDKSGVRNGLEILQLDASATNIADAMPSVFWKNSDDQSRWQTETIDMSLNMPSQIWRNLGFVSVLGDDNVTIDRKIRYGDGEAFWGANGLPSLYKSDNFIIESTSLRLDSYDASKVQYNTDVTFLDKVELSGRRKNILMTIPVNDNTDGLVEFETNSPIFIDIGNAEKINVKNLNLRVLRKNFSPIKQGNELAVMTLLIDN